MDLNMIRGLGPSVQQNMHKCNIFNVEQLVRLLPNDVVFYNKFNDELSSNIKDITLYGEILSHVEEHNQILTFIINKNGENITVEIENNHLLQKKLIPGQKIQVTGDYIDGVFKCNKYFLEEVKYELFYNNDYFTSNQLETFIKYALGIIDEKNIDLPIYLRDKYKFKTIKELLLEFNSPTSSDNFENSLEMYIFVILFNYCTNIYYFIYSTMGYRTEEIPYDLSKIKNSLEGKNVNKDILNSILLEFKKKIFSNVLLEKPTLEEKESLLPTIILSKVLLHKQVLIQTNNMDFYVNLKDLLLSYNVKLETITRKSNVKNVYENFNKGKYDVVVVDKISFSGIDTSKLGLVIIDKENFETIDRLELNCNCDTLFISNQTINKLFPKETFKNIKVIGVSNDSNYYDLITKDILKNINKDILGKIISLDTLRKIMIKAVDESHAFIRDKKFKECKEYSEYLKHNIKK